MGPVHSYTLPDIVPNTPHKYIFMFKGYKTITTKPLTYPAGTTNLWEVMVKKK